MGENKQMKKTDEKKSKMQLIKEYIEKCPLLKGDQINVDYLKDEVYSYSIDRIGRIFDIHIDYIKRGLGYSIMLECVRPSYLKSVITSKVISYCIGKNFDYIIIYTENSIYYFRRVYL